MTLQTIQINNTVDTSKAILQTINLGKYTLSHNLLVTLTNQLSNMNFTEYPEEYLTINNTLKESLKQLTLNYRKLIKCGDYSTLSNIQKMIDIINSLNITINDIEEIKFKGHVENSKVESLKLGDGVLFTQVTEDIRGSGKTKSIIKKANELNCTIVTGSRQMKQNIENLAKTMNLDVHCVCINSIDNIRGGTIKNKSFLVDEGISNEIIKELIKSGNAFIGGFNSLKDTIKSNYKNEILQFLNKELTLVKNKIDIHKWLTPNDIPNTLLHDYRTTKQLLENLKMEDY